MTVLILHRNPLEPFPYRRWLADLDDDLVVLAARDAMERFGERVPRRHPDFTHLEVLDDFADPDRVLHRALELADRFAVTDVVALQEGDLEPAARLRERRGLPGPWPADVLPFRDKAVMKRRLGAAGVPVAPYRVPDDAGAAWAFAADHGYPLVSKCRAGWNSVDLAVLGSPAELAGHLAGTRLGGDRVLEAWVPGRMCHVDGLVVDGRVALAWPSQYQYALSSFGADPGARVDLTLDPGDPLTPRLLSLAERALAALRRPECEGGPEGEGGPEVQRGAGSESRMPAHAFHAEIFHTPDDRLVLCEIAARPGGAKIREVFGVLFGHNLGELATRAHLGLPLPGVPAAGPAPVPAAMSGQLLMMKRPGRVAALPAAPPRWVRHEWRYAAVGDELPPAAGSADFLLAAVGAAPDRAECERRLRALGARWEAETRIETPVQIPVESPVQTSAGTRVGARAGARS